MLVLTRRVGEEIVIADNIRVMVVTVRGQTTRLGITAPPSVPVVRLELLAGRPDGAWSPTPGGTGKPQEKGCAATESAS
jgi:carbon storage regulator CsrA